MKTWRDMNATERKQDKYDRRRVRIQFDRAAANSKSSGVHTMRRSKRAKPTRRIVPQDTKVSRGWSGSTREQDRRKRQIERGQLREANGLVR